MIRPPLQLLLKDFLCSREKKVCRDVMPQEKAARVGKHGITAAESCNGHARSAIPFAARELRRSYGAARASNRREATTVLGDDFQGLDL